MNPPKLNYPGQAFIPLRIPEPDELYWADELDELPLITDYDIEIIYTEKYITIKCEDNYD